MDHYRPDDDQSDRSKHVVIITIGKYSPVKAVLVFSIYTLVVYFHKANSILSVLAVNILATQGAVCHLRKETSIN